MNLIDIPVALTAFIYTTTGYLYFCLFYDLLSTFESSTDGFIASNVVFMEIEPKNFIKYGKCPFLIGQGLISTDYCSLFS